MVSPKKDSSQDKNIGRILRVTSFLSGLFMLSFGLLAGYYLFFTKNPPPGILRKILERVLSGIGSLIPWEKLQLDTSQALVGIFAAIGIGISFLFVARIISRELNG